MKTKRTDSYNYRIGEMLAIGVIIILSLLAIVKTIFVSTDIDESYAIATAYRLLKGDTMFFNMWEPHQLSAYFPAVMLWIYETIKGDLEYSVIFLRVLGTVAQFLLGILLAECVRKRFGSWLATALFLLHINFLPKWLQIPEFEWLNYVMLLSVFILSITCVDGYWKKWKLIVLGIIMALQLLNYPTMILLYPVYMYGLCRGSNEKGKNVVISTLGALLAGGLFLIYLCLGTEWERFWVALKYIFADPSHAEKTLLLRFSEYGVMMVKDIVVMALLMLLLYGILLFVKGLERKQRLLLAVKIEVVLYALLCCVGMLFADQNQFFLQSRYLICILLGVFSYSVGEKDKIQRMCLFFGIIPCVVSLFATLLVTNMTINVAYSKLFVGVVASFIIVFSNEEDVWDRRLTKYMLLSNVMVLIVCKLVLIRVTGCIPVTMRAELKRLENGAWKGIFVLEDQGVKRDNNYEVLSKYVDAEDTVLYFGCDSSVYADLQAEVAASSVQGTAVFNQDFIDYFFEFPEKYPSVVVVDKNYPMDFYFVYSPYNYILQEWIEHDYRYSEIVETENLRIYTGNS